MNVEFNEMFDKRNCLEQWHANITFVLH